jgi:hypothetical protein
MGRVRLAAVGASAMLILCALGASLSAAEISQKQGVRVIVSGALSPKRLPRKGSTPVAVLIKGEITSSSAEVLPQLKRLTIAINSAGNLNLTGIPHCRINHINPSTNQEALAACRSSLVGEGTFSANVVLPEQSPFPSRGKLLAFNGQIGRKPAISLISTAPSRFRPPTSLPSRSARARAPTARSSKRLFLRQPGNGATSPGLN